MADYLDIAIKAAKEAGKIHKKYFKGDFKVETKTSSFDLLTTADREAERTVVALIKKEFPLHNIIGEEFKYKKTASEYVWIIDPLDGTTNFVSGLPIFCVSIALVYKNEVITAAVYDVTRDELFYAQKNKGAFLNAGRIYVNQAKSLKEALIITGFYYNRGKEMIKTLSAIKRFLSKGIRGIRRLGAAALDLCYIASGRVSGYWEFRLSPWDFAAGKLLIEEAGGKITGKSGEGLSLMDKSFVVASNGKIHTAMLKVINEDRSFS